MFKPACSSTVKPFTCVESASCNFATATKSKLITHMMNLHSMTHLEAKEDIDQREFDLSLPEGRRHTEH